MVIAMANDDKIELEGRIVEVLKGTKYKVELDNGHIVDCTLAGKLRMNHITVILGDKVTVQISPYDLTKGIISWRSK